MDSSLTSALDRLSEALLRARLRAPAATQMFPRGHAGLALAHAGLEDVVPDRGHADRSAAALSSAIDVLGRGAAGPHLFGGFTGLAWVVEHLRQPSGEDSNGEIDAVLLDHLTSKRWGQTYDLIGGLVGYGVYGLERMPEPSAPRLLEAVVAHLTSCAEAQPGGVAWRTKAAWKPREKRTDLSYGFNLGVAHGVPGVIALLGRIWRVGIAKRDVGNLLDGAVPWLLAQELAPSSPSAFGYSVRRGHAPAPARAAWCYGDPGIAAALLVAARATGETGWEREAVRIGLRAAARDPETCEVVDAGLCHGAGGLAHIFNRLHVATGDERFDKAARVWLGRTVAMHRPGRGFGGYRSAALSADGRAMRLVSDSSFLSGTPGIALALAGFASPKTAGWAKWDRALLLSDTPLGERTLDSRSRAAE